MMMMMIMIYDDGDYDYDYDYDDADIKGNTSRTLLKFVDAKMLREVNGNGHKQLFKESLRK